MTIFDHFGGHFGDLFWAKNYVKIEAVIGRRESDPRDEQIWTDRHTYAQILCVLTNSWLSDNVSYPERSSEILEIG